MKRLLPLLFLGLILPFTILSQCEDGRYRNIIFSDFTVESNIIYGSNIDYLGGTQELKLDVYRPEGDSETDRPLLIMVHGGAYVTGSKTGTDVVPLCQDFARMGYVVASIQYRLGVNFFGDLSTEFAQAVLRGTHDSRAAVRFFRKDVAENGNSYGIDPEQIFMAGVSAGAFNALHLAYLDTEAELSAYVDQSIAGLGGGVQGETGNDGYSSEVTGIINISGALADPELMQEGDTPVCSFHGTGDTVVPFATDMLTLAGIFDVDTVYGSATIDARAEELGLEHCFFVQFLEGHVPHEDNAFHYDTLRSISTNFLSHFVCPDTELDCEYRVLDIVSSVEEIDVDVARIWPNPAERELNINLGHVKSAQFTILDLTGQEVKRGQIQQGNATLSVDGLKTGLYLLQVSDHSGTRTFRFHKSGN